MEKRELVQRFAVWPSVFMWGALLVLSPAAGFCGTVDYGRDIRPILSDRCFACHGPDKEKREADLRLDERAVALAQKAIVPGDAAASPLIARVTSEDDDERMPPADSHKKPLTADEIQLFQQWIQEGAVYGEHWSYAKLVRPPAPHVKDKSWPRNPVDQFIAATLEARNLKPSAEADRRTLIRRLSFDLTGLPPSPQRVARFLAADSLDKAYAELVEELLQSDQFGERMALYWLDLVRFADTGGYHSDNHRDLAAYRDYVIDSFNSNKPFDQFTLEQLAGDLLPAATLEQKIGSAYNRLLQTTEEGGAQRKEYLAIYAADRVRNVSGVWLGTTLGCCQCHDHKYDPFSQRDFYSMGAFFADLRENVPGRQTPNLRVPTPAQAAQMEKLRRQIAEAEAGQVPASFLPGGDLAAALTQWEGAVKKPTEDLPDSIVEILALPDSKRTPAQQQTLTKHYLSTAAELAPWRAQTEAWKKELAELDKSLPTMLVSEATAPREMRILARGNWQDDSGEIVQPNTPLALVPPRIESERRANRLDLARWIVSRDNPLTARVLVNRLWYLMFGNGLSRSLDDVGHQGHWPSHPELLDWLAFELTESGWDVKHILRLIVMSRAYRQTSAGDLPQGDPYNQWLTRQNRFRFDAETIRDNALAVSGLLTREIGGMRSVKPYQPAGFWQHLNFPTRTYQADQGPDQYRRGLYTYWCRTFPHPSLTSFDAPGREECTAQRPRSNTPLQALVLLNDPTYVEAARVLAQNLLKQSSEDPQQRIRWVYQQVLSRDPNQQELAILQEVQRQQENRYQQDQASAKKLLETGQAPVPETMDAVELASWTTVARVILNLHETITRS